VIASIAVAAAATALGGKKKKKKKTTTEPEWDDLESGEDEDEHEQPVPEPQSKKPNWESGIRTTTRGGERKKDPEWDDSESEDEKIASKSVTLERESGNAFGSDDEERIPKRRRTRHSVADRAVGSAKRSRGGDRSEDKDDYNDNLTIKPHGGTHRPSREVLGWIRTMSPMDQRKHVNVGMRVKVRFKDNVWYGGIIARVLSLGHKIKINFDDGTVEVSDFPDRDIVVDDQGNGRHRVDAQKFIPLREPLLSSNDNDSEQDENEGEKEEGDSPPQANRANPDSSDSNDSFDTDEEEELGALIYRSSLTAQGTATTNNRQS